MSSYLETLRSAFVKLTKNKSFKRFMRSIGENVVFVDGATYDKTRQKRWDDFTALIKKMRTVAERTHGIYDTLIAAPAAKLGGAEEQKEGGGLTIALQGFTLTLQPFEFWGKGTLLAFHHGRSLRAKDLCFPSIERRPTNSELFSQGPGTFLTAI